MWSQQEAFLNIFYSRGQQMFSGKGQRAKAGFKGRTDSVASAHLRRFNVKGAVDPAHTTHHVPGTETSMMDTDIRISHNFHMS